MRRRRVACVCDGHATELRRARHAQRIMLSAERTFAVHHVDDWRGIVGKDRRESRHVAGAIVLELEQAPDGVLVLGHRVKIAHSRL